MESRIGNVYAANKNGLKLCHGGKLSGSTHLYLDSRNRSQLFLSWVFVGHCPSRLAPLEAQVALQLQRVDLVDHAINVVGQRIAAGAHLLVKRYQFSSAQGNGDLRCDRETP